MMLLLWFPVSSLSIFQKYFLFLFLISIVNAAGIVTAAAATVSGNSLQKNSATTSSAITISKCCGLNETLTFERKCIKILNDQWTLRIYNNSSLKTYNHLPNGWQVKENSQPKCLNNQLMVISDLSYKSFVLRSNGYAYAVDYQKQLPLHQYCLDYKFVMFCPNFGNNGRSVQLVKKCCGQNAIYTQTNQSCTHLNNSTMYNIDIGENKTFGAGFPICLNNTNRIVAGKYQRESLYDNGTLMLVSQSDEEEKIHLEFNNYCLEHILEEPVTSASIITCQNYIPSTFLIGKKRINGDNTDNLKFTIYPIGLAISVIFLAATLAAGSLLPASHHVLHWKCQTNHVICLLIGDVLLCITQIFGAKLNFSPCFLTAVAMHFFFLAAFFWLNTMCFNIWWTFKDLRPQSTEKNQERIRFYMYQAYAWGVPLIIVFIGAVADLAGSGTSSNDFLRPKFAEDKCWFNGDSEIFTYFFGPIGFLLIVNLLLFILTARELTCGLWKRELVKSTTERAALGRICLKLVVVMGVTWIVDIISWAVGGPDSLWYLTDLFNCLQGVFIFIVVGCQPQVLSAIKRSWCHLRNTNGSDNGGPGTLNHNNSSSSQGLPSMAGDDTLTNTSTITHTKSVPPLETNC